MKKIPHLLINAASYALIASFAVAPLVPMTAFAATKSSTSDSTASKSASIDIDTLLVDSGQKPRLTGTTTDSVAKIRVSIVASSTGKTVYKSSRITVKRDDTWSVRVSKKLADGTYNVYVQEDLKGKLTRIGEGTLYVGIPPVTLRVTPIALLSGGIAHPGTTVPISYLQVVNQSSSTAALKGFWVRQDGSAPVSSIIGFSSVDGTGTSRASVGGLEGATPFVNGLAYVPSTAILAPGERKLFTLKVQLSSTSGRSAGTALMLNVTGIDAAAKFNASFPITGTTWTLSAY
jgi:hypothetical protein